MQITFRLWKCQKKEPKHGWQIIADITWDCIQQRLATGERCFEENWKGDMRKQRFVENTQPYASEINHRLKKFMDTINDIFRDAELKGEMMRRHTLKERFALAKAEIKNPNLAKKIAEAEKAKPITVKKVPNFSEIAGQYTSTLKNPNYKRGFKQVLGHLLNFRKELKTEDISYHFLSEYVEYLYDTANLESNTISIHIKKIKTILNDSVKKGIKVDASYDDFSHSYIDPDIVFLLPDEIDMLKSVKLDDEALKQTRDFFVFGCYVGARYSDLSIFTQSNISQTTEGNILRYRPKKTPKKVVNILLIDEAMEIINRYSGNKTGLILPKLSNDELNKNIKEVAKKASIDNEIIITEFRKDKFKEVVYKKYEKITGHCSRHTFATICFMAGMEERLVQEFLGHSKVEMTKKYIHIANSYKSKNMKNAWAKKLVAVEG